MKLVKAKPKLFLQCLGKKYAPIVYGSDMNL